LSIRRIKSGRHEEEEKGTFWRVTALDVESRLRVGRAIAKIEAEAAHIVMEQIQKHMPQEPSVTSADSSCGISRSTALDMGTRSCMVWSGKTTNLSSTGSKMEISADHKKRKGR
jgi:hypothetical protein